MKTLIAVLGASGYLGQHVAKHFRDLNENNVVLTFDLSGATHALDLTDGLSLLPFLEKSSQGEPFEKLVLVNCAGMTVFTDTRNRTPKEISEVAMSQLGISILGINALAQACREKGIPGVGILVSSIFASHAPRFEIYEDLDRRSSEIYGATKAGVEQLTRYYAKLYGAEGIRINCVSPGGILDASVHTSDFQRKYASATALRRMVSPQEVVEAISFLVSDKSSAITGTVLAVDCGYGL